MKDVSGDNGHTVEIYANVRIARTFLAFSLCGLALAAYTGAESIGARLRPFAIAISLGGGLVAILKLRPGPSVVLSETEISVRRPFAWRSVAYNRISKIEDIRVPLGRADNGPSLNPVGRKLNHFVTIRVLDGRPLNIQAVDVAIPLSDFRTMLVDRCR